MSLFLKKEALCVCKNKRNSNSKFYFLHAVIDPSVNQILCS